MHYPLINGTTSSEGHSKTSIFLVELLHLSIPMWPPASGGFVPNARGNDDRCHCRFGHPDTPRVHAKHVWAWLHNIKSVA